MPIQPTGRNGSSYQATSSQSSVKEKMRAEYNPSTKTFEPMGAGKTDKIEHLEAVEGKVAEVKVPSHFTPKYYQGVAAEMTYKGQTIDAETSGVGSYFSGDAALYDNFISSISDAQSQI